MPGRIFSYNIGITIPWICFTFLVLILCVYLRDEQPLKSRGLGPILITFTAILPVTTEYILAYALDYETQYYYECYLTSFILYTPFQVGGLIVTIHYFRYIVILNMQAQKKKSMESESILKDWKIRFINRITHPVIIFLLPIIWMLGYSIVVLIIYTFVDFKCGTIAYRIIQLYALGNGGLFLIIVFLLYTWDCIQNYKLLINCKFKKFFLTNDHYFYRLELSTSPILFLIIIIWLGVPMPTLIKIMFTEAMHFFVLWFCCFFILFMTIYKKISERLFYKNKEEQGDLAQIFENDDLYEQFLEFSKNEWSMENVYFKRYCLDYRKAPLEERKRIVAKMIHLFLNFEESLFEMNVTKQSIMKVLKNVENNNYSDDLFIELEIENQSLLTNIMGRFRFSYEYQFYLSKMSIIKGV